MSREPRPRPTSDAHWRTLAVKRVRKAFRSLTAQGRIWTYEVLAEGPSDREVRVRFQFWDRTLSFYTRQAGEHVDWRYVSFPYTMAAPEVRKAMLVMQKFAA